MAVQHAKFLALALRLIRKHGRTIDIHRKDQAPADAAKPWKGASANPDEVVTVKGCFVPYKSSDFGSDWLDVDLFKEVDEICLVAGDPATLERFHIVKDDDGSKMRIVATQRLKPGATTLLYALGLMR